MKRVVAWVSGSVLVLFVAGCVAVPVVGIAAAVLMRAKEAGQWVGTADGVRTEISFDSKAGTATVKTSAPKFGLEAGKTLVMGYEIDAKDSPIFIDFVMLDPDGESERGRIKGIMNFISGDVLTICFCLDGVNRPESFKTAAESGVYSVVFSKVR